MSLHKALSTVPHGQITQ